MKTIRFLLLLAVLLLATSRCFALIMIHTVSKEQAMKDFGATIRTETVGTNQVGVRLEFIPKGKLQTFSSVQLEITSGERRVVSADLSPLKQTADAVVIYFSTDPSYLATSTLTLFYKTSGGVPPYDGLQFNVRDFIKHDSSH